MQGGIIRVRFAKPNGTAKLLFIHSTRHKRQTQISNADDKKSAHEWATFRSSSSSTLDGSVPTYNEL